MEEFEVFSVPLLFQQTLTGPQPSLGCSARIGLVEIVPGEIEIAVSIDSDQLLKFSMLDKSRGFAMSPWEQFCLSIGNCL